MTLFINDTANKYQHFSDKHEAYNFYFNICPRLKFKRINYIKKAKKEDTKEEEVILPDFLSKKEYNMYVDLLKETNI
jgi:predicted 3-demethylubiquinone-9 3-methyltransferase (glyoxalase superfamily)